jgi:hypothetical protein
VGWRHLAFGTWHLAFGIWTGRCVLWRHARFSPCHSGHDDWMSELSESEGEK